MPTENSNAARVLLVCALGIAMHAHAAAPGADSPYRLRLADADAYRLAPEYRSAAEKAAETAAAAASHPDDALAIARAAAARAEMEAKPFAKQIEKAANKASLDPALVHAVIYVESRHQPAAVSAKGALGLMQVLPDTAARYGITNPMRTERNLQAGTRYLAYLMQRFPDRLDLALAAYNAGEGAVAHYANRVPPYPETREYVRAVMEKYEQWRSPVQLVAASAPAAPVAAVPGSWEPPPQPPTLW